MKKASLEVELILKEASVHRVVAKRKMGAKKEARRSRESEDGELDEDDDVITDLPRSGDDDDDDEMDSLDEVQPEKAYSPEIPDHVLGCLLRQHRTRPGNRTYPHRTRLTLHHPSTNTSAAWMRTEKKAAWLCPPTENLLEETTALGTPVGLHFILNELYRVGLRCESQSYPRIVLSSFGESSGSSNSVRAIISCRG